MRWALLSLMVGAGLMAVSFAQALPAPEPALLTNACGGSWTSSARCLFLCIEPGKRLRVTGTASGGNPGSYIGVAAVCFTATASCSAAAFGPVSCQDDGDEVQVPSVGVCAVGGSAGGTYRCEAS